MTIAGYLRKYPFAHHIYVSDKRCRLAAHWSAGVQRHSLASGRCDGSRWSGYTAVWLLQDSLHVSDKRYNLAYCKVLVYLDCFHVKLSISPWKTGSLAMVFPAPALLIPGQRRLGINIRQTWWEVATHHSVLRLLASVLFSTMWSRSCFYTSELFCLMIFRAELQ